MKKIFLVFAIVFLSSCSHDDDKIKEIQYDGPRHMDTPTWIQGVWMDDHDRAFKFTDNDLLYKYPMLNYSSASSEIDDYEKYYWKRETYQNPNIQEVEIIDYYSVKYNCIDNQSSKKFSFKRLSETQMEATGIMPGIYTKQ